MWRTRLVDYEAAGAAALTALMEWVERAEPPKDTADTMTADKDIVIPREPALRGGVQPAVTLHVAGGSRVDVVTGTTVAFDGWAAAPDGAGAIVDAAMDFEGDDVRPCQIEVDGSSTVLKFSASHVFDTPGTYFPVLRVGSHRQGAGHRGESVRNLARMRVVVSGPTPRILRSAWPAAEGRTLRGCRYLLGHCAPIALNRSTNAATPHIRLDHRSLANTSAMCHSPNLLTE